MEFGALPPEVNSGRLYAGPGSGSLNTAATAWARLAAELGAAARGYESVISELTVEAWRGPASESMAAAAAPYAAWLVAAAAQTEQAAAQAAAAAGAFDEAYAAVVPPPVIAANRSELASLVASNLLGQNSAAIAATEAQYLQMWVQDAGAMYGYAGRAAAATAVTPFTGPPAGNLGGSAGKAAVVAAGGAHTQLSQLINAIPRTLQGLSMSVGSPASVAAALQPLQSAALPSATQIASYFELVAKLIVPFNDAIKSLLYAMVQFARNLTTDLDLAALGNAAVAAGPATPALVSADAGVAGAVASARVGGAGMIGQVSVPGGWLAAAPVAQAAAAALPATAAAPMGAPQLPVGVFTDMALAGLAGRAIAGTAGRGGPGGSVSVASAMNGHAQGRLERMVTELAGTHEVQHWHVDASRLDALLEELAEQPGVHAVHVNDDGQDDGRRNLELPPQPGPG